MKQLAELFPHMVEDLSRGGTVDAANAWWTAKLQEIEAEKNAPAVRVAKIVRDFQKSLRTQAAEARDLTLLAEIDLRISRIESLLQNGKGIDGLSLREPDGSEESEIDLVEVGKRLPTTMAKQYRREVLRRESARFDDVLPVTLPEYTAERIEDRSLEAISKRWLSDREASARRKAANGTREISAGRYTEIRAHLKDFGTFAGPGATIDSINTSTLLTDYRTKLLTESESGKIALETVRSRLGTLKQFLRWAYESEITDKLPRNISSPTLAVGKDVREPQLFDVAQFRRILAASPDRTKLFLLLIANCGFRQSDIAELRLREVDFPNGRIAHARIKTAKKNPPVVLYKLWDETAQLLRDHVVNEKRPLIPDSRLFVNENGTPLVTRMLDSEGNEKHSNNITSAYWRVLRKIGIQESERRSMGAIRTTSANLIRRQYGHELQQRFLGHKFGDVASVHYSTTHDDFRLDAPLEWLRSKYGLPLPETAP